MKKKLSRLLCALLVMTMVLAMVPAVSAAEVYDSYKNTNKTATVTLEMRVTITFPHSTSKHDQQKNIVYAIPALHVENESIGQTDAHGIRLSIPLRRTARKNMTIITYCTECKGKRSRRRSRSNIAPSVAWQMTRQTRVLPSARMGRNAAGCYTANCSCEAPRLEVKGQ